MAKIQKCSKCNREYSLFSCPYCTEESKPTETKVVKDKEVVKKIDKETIKVNSEKPKLATTDNFINWLQYNFVFNLQSYTASELNHKFWKNLNSIKSEKICIEYEWRYILHEDIINQFRESLITNK